MKKSIKIAFFFLLAAILYSFPHYWPYFYTAPFQNLAADPFNWDVFNHFRNRILTPVLAHFLGFKGSLYPVFPILIGGLFLFFIHKHYKDLIYPALMAFSMPLLHNIYCTGFTDTTSYLLVFTAMITIKSPIAWAFYALSLLNHESNLFVLPWLLFLANWEFERRRFLLSIMFALLSLLPMIYWRLIVAIYSPVIFSADYYLSIANVIDNFRRCKDGLYIGIFMSFKLFWIFPIYAIYFLFQRARYKEAILIISIIICPAFQLLIAHDISRLMALAFPAILFGAAICKEAWGVDFPRRAWLIALVNLFIPQCFVNQSLITPMHSILWPF